ncbi:hypothetical protein [Campylobacter geochelonis]|uniref:hypothetical protein n=1 Tax=Campylobacter geochelonis TaxID=1780362 RepID=UPI000770B5BB|nr:hypothetical protein [Campylobacter geochelonis]CZE47852.1 Uncharacterised protein [Campylobacter geochelonis]
MQTPVYEEFRKSWTAYVKSFIFFIILVILTVYLVQNSQNISKFTLSLSEKTGFMWINEWCKFALVVILLLLFLKLILNVLYIRSFKLYTDKSGVWLYSGIFPWSKGSSGIKWQDIEDASYYTGFVSWLCRSWTVQVTHRFTKSSSIYQNNMAKGQRVVEHINELHKHFFVGNSDEINYN